MKLIDRNCPVCHLSDCLEAFDQPTEVIVGMGDIGYHHKIQICKGCGFVFAGPLLPQEKILAYYEKMSNYEQPQNEGLRPVAEMNQIHRYFGLIKKRFPLGFTGKVLDVGCATAFGLMLFKSEGWNVLGIDPSQKCVELSKQHYGVNVIRGFFNPELLQEEKPFDLIILCHVLEHLINPGQVIRELKKLLSDRGLLYVEVPNLLKPYAPKCYFGFEHVNFFTPRSLTNLMSVNGLAKDEIILFDNGPEYSPFYPVVASTWRHSQEVLPISNDFPDAAGVIESFKQKSKELVSGIQDKIKLILDNTPKGMLAIWGAGIHTSQLLSETALGAADIYCIFDNDPKKHGSRLGRFPIKKLSGDPADVKLHINAILISSEASEGLIYKQISYLEKVGIKIYRLYE